MPRSARRFSEPGIFDKKEEEFERSHVITRPILMRFTFLKNRAILKEVKLCPVEKFRMIMFYNYVLQSRKNKNLYVGYTADLKKRLKEHNQGLNQSTKLYRPWKLIYYEACLNGKDAKRRESYLKTSQGQRLLKRRVKEYFYELNK